MRKPCIMGILICVLSIVAGCEPSIEEKLASYGEFKPKFAPSAKMLIEMGKISGTVTDYKGGFTIVQTEEGWGAMRNIGIGVVTFESEAEVIQALKNAGVR